MRLQKTHLTTSISLALLIAAPAFAVGTLDRVDLSLGVTDENEIRRPVLAADGVAPVVVADFEAAYNPSDLIVRRLKRRVPQFNSSPSLDLAALFASTVRDEGRAMGLDVGSSEREGAFTVRGSLDGIYMETLPTWGPILFYGYLELSLEVTAPDGRATERDYRLHQIVWRHNAGFGVRDEATEALAETLIECAQDLVALLNRDFFHAPPHASIESTLTALTASGVDDHEIDVRRVGLSGSADAVDDLLALLEREKDESERYHVVDALAQIGHEDAIEALTGRFASEDEDVRYFIIKALDYIGGEQAERFIAERGRRDGDKAVASLSARIAE